MNARPFFCDRIEYFDEIEQVIADYRPVKRELEEIVKAEKERKPWTPRDRQAFHALAHLKREVVSRLPQLTERELDEIEAGLTQCGLSEVSIVLRATWTSGRETSKPKPRTKADFLARLRGKKPVIVSSPLADLEGKVQARFSALKNPDAETRAERERLQSALIDLENRVDEINRPRDLLAPIVERRGQAESRRIAGRARRRCTFFIRL